VDTCELSLHKIPQVLDDLVYNDRHTQETATNVWQLINNAPQVEV